MRPGLDDHGQPKREYFIKRIRDRGIHEMLGLAKGIVCDGEVSEEECLSFGRWLTANPEVTAAWPGSVLAKRLLTIYSDGMVTKNERHELYELLCDTVGDGGHDDALSVNQSTRLPYDDPPASVTFDKNTFVLTGRFYYGIREKCEIEIVARGGKCRDTVIQRPLTVVVGGIASAAWIQSSFGRKIEKAVEYRDAGCAIRIISEERWCTALEMNLATRSLDQDSQPRASDLPPGWEPGDSGVTLDDC